jgi:hypothetical protein
MKKILSLLAMVAVLAACNDQNKPQNPEEQKQAEFAKARYFQVTGTNQVPSENYTQDNVTAYVVIGDEYAVISLAGVGFSSRMPVTVDMDIDSVSYTRSADRITLSAQNVMPKMKGAPVSRYLINQLSGYITPDSLVFTNNYGSYQNCVFAGKVVLMAESNVTLEQQ